MNERILEIAKEADPSGWYCGIDPRVMDPEIKKFAEMIVTKCAVIATRCESNGTKNIGAEILEHFGVK